MEPWLIPIVAKVKSAMETGAEIARVRLTDEESQALGDAFAAGGGNATVMDKLNVAFGELGGDHITCKQIELNVRAVNPMPGRLTMTFNLTHNN